MTKLHSHLLALAVVALVAFAGVESPHYGTATFLVVLIGAVLVGAVALKIRSRNAKVAAVLGASTQSERGNFVTTKRILIAFMALGIAAYIGGGGTFSTFNAETQNPGSSVSSGTLTLTDQVNTGTVCASINAATLDNANQGYITNPCQAALNITNLAPGAYDTTSASTGASLLTLTNTGSLDASRFTVYGSYVNGALSTPLVSGAAVAGNTVVVSSLEGPVTSGDTIILSYGTHTETCTAGASTAASNGSATINISGGANACGTGVTTWNFSYPAGTRVRDTSSNASPTTTDCWDSQTTAAKDGAGNAIAGASYGTQLNFNPVTGNPMCTAALFWVQEVTFSGGVINPGVRNYCWSGKGSSPEDSLGMCAAPINAALTGTTPSGGPPYTIDASTTALAISTGLRGNIKSGDTLTITDKTVSASATCTAGANAYIGATSITLTGACTSLVNNTAFTSGNTYIVDTTTLNSLNSDTTDTISNFDTAHNQTGAIQLYPISANGTANTNALVELNRAGTANSATQPGATRYFYVGVYLPAPPGTSQNQLQGLTSTFGFNWHIDQ
jgi:hypothetical protein